MTFIPRALCQAGTIVVLAAVISLAVNALRPDGLPLVHATRSVVKANQPGGEISLQDAVLLHVTSRAVFLDARTREEFEEGHIKGALCLPVDEFPEGFAALEIRLRSCESIIAYCDGERCPLSHELAEKLMKKGFKNVTVLRNGWTLWKNEGLPVTRDTTR